MDGQKFIITASITIGLAIFGYIAKYVNDIRIAKRKDKLDRINRQLKELYGPLYSLTSSSNATWNVFRQKFRNNTFSYMDKQNPPTETEKEIWRTWIKTVFFPINEKVYNLILENGDLIIENHFPEPLRALCAHYESYKPVIAQWQENNFSEHLALIIYPQDLLIYAEKSFQYLKQKQRELIE